METIPIRKSMEYALGKFKMPYPPSEAIGIEIYPVKSNEDKDGNTQCEICEPSECDFYGIYIRYKCGEVMLLKDIDLPEDIASLFALFSIL